MSIPTGQTNNAPSLTQFHSVSAWLDAWVRFKLLSTERLLAFVPSGEALYLYGTIGFDAALSPDGTVWVNDYIETDEVNWQVATESERLVVLGRAQSQSFSELIALLPTNSESGWGAGGAT